MELEAPRGAGEKRRASYHVSCSYDSAFYKIETRRLFVLLMFKKFCRSMSFKRVGEYG